LPSADALTGLNDFYIDLSQIETKIILRMKLDPEALKAELVGRLRTAGMRVVDQRESAGGTLKLQISCAPELETAAKVRALLVLATIEETITYQRLNGTGSIPVWLGTSLSLIEGPSDKLTAPIHQIIQGCLDGLVSSWQRNNQERAT
jgi:hypothetical protein